MKIRTWITIFLCSSFSAFSQPQHENWYFGFNAGLSFNSGAPVALTNGALSTDEGVASISDASGQILFYTNGETVYNKQHQVMQNGTGLLGSFTTSQSAIIVPDPSDTMRYFVFTQAAQAGFGVQGQSFGGLAYSVVDLGLNSGNGAVTLKNQILADTTCESLSATSRPDGRSYWVATHKWYSDAFYLYKVDCNGVSTSPVVSNSGRIHTDTAQYNPGSIGCMKFSPDGKKLAIVWSDFSDDQYSFARTDIFDFNNVTGKLTLSDTINFLSGSNVLERGYGVEFSPDSRFVYATTFGLINGTAFSHLYQIDLDNSDPNGTKQFIVNEFKAMGTLQLGPDEKIYVARLNGTAFLSVINYPDSLGFSCQYVSNQVSLNGFYSTWGLPNNWNTYLTPGVPEILAFNDTTICAGNAVLLYANLPFNDPAYSFTWSNGLSGRVILATTPGTYTVIASNGCNVFSESVNVNMENCNCTPFIPNIVTLNGDGRNDSFRISERDCSFSNYLLLIYSRWGNKVFESANVSDDFIPESSGTYFYILKYRMAGSSDDTLHKGVITVIDK